MNAIGLPVSLVVVTKHFVTMISVQWWHY